MLLKFQFLRFVLNLNASNMQQLQLLLIALFLFQTLIFGFRRDDFLVLRMLMGESLKLYY